jgi:hypothetical protein
VKLALNITLSHVSGPEQDAETMVDALCGTIGADNGAGKDALRVVVPDWDDASAMEVESVYIVKLADTEP